MVPVQIAGEVLEGVGEDVEILEGSGADTW